MTNKPPSEQVKRLEEWTERLGENLRSMQKEMDEMDLSEVPESELDEKFQELTQIEEEIDEVQARLNGLQEQL